MRNTFPILLPNLAWLMSAATHASVDIPIGYEVIEIASGPMFHHRPRMNNCGQFVYFRGLIADADSEIMLYDNGRIDQITDNNVADSYPDIAENGTVVWMRASNLVGNGDIILLAREGESVIGFGNAPTVNNNGQVAWSRAEPESCAFESSIYLFDGVSAAPITNNALSNQGVKINDAGDLVWTEYHFCDVPFWTSEIILYSNQTAAPFPSNLDYAQGPDINNLGQAAWGDGQSIEHWDGTETVWLTEGVRPTLNDRGDMAFQRASPNNWQVWVYLNGEYHMLTDPQVIYSNGLPDINNDGEVVWHWTHSSLSPAGIRLMRRIRNGDVNLDFAIDQSDFQALPGCLTGPGDFDRLCACRFYDMDHQRDVDLSDFALFQITYANVQYPRHGCCEMHSNPAGCNDPDIEACVCALLPQCCTIEWDSYCIQLVAALGCGSCE